MGVSYRASYPSAIAGKRSSLGQKISPVISRVCRNDIAKIPNWNHKNMFSNVASDIAGAQAGIGG